MRLREGGETVARTALGARVGEKDVKVALDRAARAASRYAAAHAKATATCTSAGVPPPPLWSPPPSAPRRKAADATLALPSDEKPPSTAVLAPTANDAPAAIADMATGIDDEDARSDAGDIGLSTSFRTPEFGSATVPHHDAAATFSDDFSLTHGTDAEVSVVSDAVAAPRVGGTASSGLPPPHLLVRQGDSRDAGLSAAATNAGATALHGHQRAASIGSASEGGGSFASVSEAAAAGTAAVRSTLKRIFFRNSGSATSAAIPPGSASQTTAERIEALKNAAAAACTAADEALADAQDAWAAFLRARERLSSAFASTVVISADLERKRVAELSDALRRYTVFAASRAANIQYDVQRLSAKAEAVAHAPALTFSAANAARAAEKAVDARTAAGDALSLEELFAACGVGAGQAAAGLTQGNIAAYVAHEELSRRSSLTAGSGIGAAGGDDGAAQRVVAGQPSSAATPASSPAPQPPVSRPDGGAGPISPIGGGRRVLGMITSAFSRGKRAGGRRVAAASPSVGAPPPPPLSAPDRSDTPPADLELPSFSSGGGASQDVSEAAEAAVISPGKGAGGLNIRARGGSIMNSLSPSAAAAGLRDLMSRPRSGTSRSADDISSAAGANGVVRGPSPGVSMSVSVFGTATGERHPMGIRETTAMLQHLHLSEGPVEQLVSALFDTPASDNAGQAVEGESAPLLTTLAAFTGRSDENAEAEAPDAAGATAEVHVETSTTPDFSNMTPAKRRASIASLPSNAVSETVPALLPAALCALKDTSDGVSRLIMALDARRAEGSAQLSGPNFDAASTLLLAALDVIEARADFARAVALMAFAQVFFCVQLAGGSIPGGAGSRSVRIYLQSRMRTHALWQNSRYWESAVYDAIGTEVSKFSAARADASAGRASLLTAGGRAEKAAALEARAREADVVYGQLGFFAFTMVSFTHPEERCV